MNYRPSPLLFGAALLAGLGACQRQEITVYTAPKDSVLEAEAPPTPDAHADGGQMPSNTPPAPRADLPKLGWILPPGWASTGPGQMSAATFAIKSNAGKAGVSVTPLPNIAGQEAMIVNMWRQQAGVPDLKPEEAEAALTPVAMAGGTGKYFEITSNKDGKTGRIITAMLTRGDKTWFFKLAGDDAVVAEQKPVFLEFIKTIQFDDKAVAAVANPPAAPDSAAAAHASAAGAPSAPPTNEPPAPPALTAPETWRTLQAGQMQVAKFAVPDQGEAKAEVSVSMFSSDTGGPAANILRWRRQLGMPEISEPEAGDQAKPLDGVEDGVVADLKNDKRRMIGAIVHRGDQWWFYKLMGDDAAVDAARESFLTFAKTQPKS